MINPYQVLGVTESSSVDEVKAAFCNLAKATHPYNNGGNENMYKTFNDIVQSYVILTDLKQRKNVDELPQREIMTQNPVYGTNLYDDEDVCARADNIRKSINAFYGKANTYKKHAFKSVISGIAWCVGGLAVTIGTYMLAASLGGGSYRIAYGAIIFGGIQAFRSFVKYNQINDNLRDSEMKMLKSL